MASIIEGLFAGRAGIQSHGSAMSVLADNIANSNTTGFKSSRADFSTILAGSIGGQGGGTAVGSGSELKKVTEIFNQGTFEVTGRGLDMAIQGNGFFIVQDVGNTGQRYYTRAGNFSTDKDGNLVDQNGYNVMGFPASGTGGLQPLNLTQIDLSSVSTQNVNMGGNLNADSDVLAGGVPAVPGATFADLQTAADYSTSVTVYDGLGAPHDLSVMFFHTAAGTYTAGVYADGADITGETAGDPVQLGAVDLQFDGFGQFDSASATDVTLTGFTWANGGGTNDIDVKFDGFNQFASASSVDSITQDGTGGGSVVSFAVEGDGTLFAQLSNGETASIGRIALSTFINPEGLRRVGGTLYESTVGSGEAVVGNPQAGTFGSIVGGSLELSTSDIANDFIKMIAFQRGFQGSSRIITNINQLLNDIIQLA